MNKAIYYGAIAVSIPFLLVAFLFLLASMQNSSRMYVALFSGLPGAGLLYFGIAGLSYLRATSPENLEPHILRIAKKNGGLFSLEEVVQRLNITSEAAEAAVGYMEKRGIVSPDYKDGVAVYRAAGVGAGVGVKRRCEFCNSEYNVRDSLTQCPNCGGNIKIS